MKHHDPKCQNPLKALAAVTLILWGAYAVGWLLLRALS